MFQKEWQLYSLLLPHFLQKEKMLGKHPDFHTLQKNEAQGLKF